ncbi:MFS transporter [Solirubrobacter ginsenosidimutans]|uniref:MFS transporter n=1 Tax=Solirubrobacter ginsenosidimutans TaxID=490573 RepID=A0A9X3S0T2_9ACTN|nr:MFS transporter [Solirubrobacter ginsenosidimutans]MDA0160397.1 MFS transporter [Solirubrobacter ginsenosidimutans]
MRVLAVLVTAQVLSVANSNMIAVALPQLSSDLGASHVQRQWIVDAFVLVFAALLVAGGVLADRYGRRRAFVAGLVTFAAGSLGCALASDPGLLIGARVVQALGPPLILPASLSIVTVTFSAPGARARAIGVWGAGSGLGIAVGPLLGGVIVSGLGWRWVFGLSALAALGLASAALRLIPRDAQAAPTRRFDHLGALLVTAVLASLVFGLIEGPGRGWTSSAVLLAFATTVLLAAAFVAAERRHPAPLVDLELVRRPVFAAANLAAATLMFVMLATSVYLSDFLQTFRGSTPLQAGLTLLPLGAATALFAAASGRLTARVPARVAIVVGLLCAAGGALLLSRVGAAPGAGLLWPALFAIGAGAGIALPATTATAVAAVDAARTGMASAIHNAGRQVGATLGVAVLGSIVTAHATAGTATAYADGLSIALLVATTALVATAAITLKLVPRTRKARDSCTALGALDTPPR